MHAYVNTYMYAYVRTYIHTNIHTYIHTSYIRTHDVYTLLIVIHSVLRYLETRSKMTHFLIFTSIIWLTTFWTSRLTLPREKRCEAGGVMPPWLLVSRNREQKNRNDFKTQAQKRTVFVFYALIIKVLFYIICFDRK
jgi:hypothetical protein